MLCPCTVDKDVSDTDDEDKSILIWIGVSKKWTLVFAVSDTSRFIQDCENLSTLRTALDSFSSLFAQCLRRLQVLAIIIQCYTLTKSGGGNQTEPLFAIVVVQPHQV